MDFFKNGSGWCRRHNPRAKPKAASSKPHAPIFRKQAASLKQAIQETVPQCDIEEAAGQTTLSKLVKKLNKENAPPGGW